MARGGRYKMESFGTNMQILNRDIIKYIAVFAMLLNHIARIFLPTGSAPAFALEFIGYFTTPTMCYFLVEGYRYTGSKKRYGQRLLFFAVISQIPFSLVFQFNNLNMIYTLLCCFLILVVREKVQDQFLQRVLSISLTLATMVADWALIAPVFTILFHDSGGEKRGLARGYIMGYAFYAFVMTQSYMVESGYAIQKAVLLGLLSGTGIIASAVVILLFYNGKRARRGRTFSKWFFYIFYPGHLLVLYLLKGYVAG